MEEGFTFQWGFCFSCWRGGGGGVQFLGGGWGGGGGGGGANFSKKLELFVEAEI